MCDGEELFQWIEQELHPRRCNSEEFIYDDMESQHLIKPSLSVTMSVEVN